MSSISAIGGTSGWYPPAQQTAAAAAAANPSNAQTGKVDSDGDKDAKTEGSEKGKGA